MSAGDLSDGLPRLRLDAGSALDGDELAELAFVVVEEGLVLVRHSVGGTARRTVTCHAGRSAVVLPPSGGDVLVALTPSIVVPITSDACDRLLESPQRARLLVDGLAETLRQKQSALAAMSRLHHVDRVREKLLELARDHGRVGPGGIRLDFPLTHDLLGEMTGSARETVTRALDALQREGFVERDGRSYSIHVPPDELVLNGR